MTAFSEAMYMENQIRAGVEIRSYNSKNLDIALHVPGFCRRFEDGIKKLVAEKLARGRVEIRLDVKDESEEAIIFAVDEKRAASYYKALLNLKESLSLDSVITLDHMIAGRDMIRDEEKEIDFDLVWQVISGVVSQALSALDTMRSNEGANLFGDLEKRMEFIEAELNIIEDRAADIPRLYRERLMERIASLTVGVEPLDPVRLSQEAALLADRSDISEEIVRVHSHIKQFRQIMSSDDPGGRKLNFLIQEFNREFNTMGSKSGQAELSHTIVDLKSELEKIREQVQNIE